MKPRQPGSPAFAGPDRQNKMRWLLEEAPGSPKYNMAVDEALLAELTAQVGSPAVRVYRWDRHCVSIGRLQLEEPVRTLYPGLPIVRRPTGGRAVLHGDDLTISVAICLSGLPEDCRSVLTSHHLIMSSVLKALQAQGLEVCFGGCAIGSQAGIVNCFELSAACDLIDSHTGEKLVGSAQRREGAALLQQMSLPLRILTDRIAFLGCLRTEFRQTFLDKG